MIQSAKKRSLKRSLTRIRNTEADRRSRGAQVKVEENYLTSIDTNTIKTIPNLRQAIAKSMLWHTLGRKMSSTKTTGVSDLMMKTSTSTRPIVLVPAVDLLYTSLFDFFENVASIVTKSLFLETCIDTLRRTAKQSTQSRVEDLQSDPDISCIFFSNEHCSNIHVQLLRTETDAQRRARAICRAIKWIQDLFNQATSSTSTDSNCLSPRFILLTEDVLVRKQALQSGVHDVCGCHELLVVLQELKIGTVQEINAMQNLATFLIQQKKEKEQEKQKQKEKEKENKYTDDKTGETKEKQIQFDLDEPFEHYDPISIQTLLKKNVLYTGKIDHDRFQYAEGWCDGLRLDADGNSVELGDTTTQIMHTRLLLKGKGSMNRAMHGDQVVVRVASRSLWRCSESDMRLANDNNGNKKRKQNKRQSMDVIPNGVQVVPTGVVVGILKQGCRQYVCTLQRDDNDEHVNNDANNNNANNNTNNTNNTNTKNVPEDLGRERHLLCVPMNSRIPKVRLRTRQYHTLKGQRLLVAIDHWAVSSMYPDGHVVRTLGAVGDLKTEAECLLIEHHLVDHLRPFAISALSELPKLDSDPNHTNGGWDIPQIELDRRRDLRTTRRVVSIDPPGCQDIDDALSVHILPNGNYEIGVHIADVTSFVRQGSTLDVEALHRGTTVYMVDRRLDMLPTLLSTNLCSLLCDVDRLAMSVIWEFDSKTLNRIENKTWFGRTIIQSNYALVSKSKQEQCSCNYY